MKVLLIETDETWVGLLTLVLTGLGYEVIRHDPGPTAYPFWALTPYQFSLIITNNHRVGKENGCSLARAIHHDRPILPIIMVTGNPNVKEPKHLLDEGVLTALFDKGRFDSSDFRVVVTRIFDEQ